MHITKLNHLWLKWLAELGKWIVISNTITGIDIMIIMIIKPERLAELGHGLLVRFHFCPSSIHPLTLLFYMEPDNSCTSITIISITVNYSISINVNKSISISISNLRFSRRMTDP